MLSENCLHTRFIEANFSISSDIDGQSTLEWGEVKWFCNIYCAKGQNNWYSYTISDDKSIPGSDKIWS